MEFIITVAVIIIAIYCLSIDTKLRQQGKQNEVIIALLKESGRRNDTHEMD